MSEQSNTALVQRAYASFRTGDIDSFLNLLADEVRWEVPEMPAVPFAGTRCGREEVALFFQKMSETQDVLEFEPEEFIARGDAVVALGRFTMRIRATGREARSAWAHLWKWQRGRATLVREYVDALAVNTAHTPLE